MEGAQGVGGCVAAAHCSMHSAAIKHNQAQKGRDPGASLEAEDCAGVIGAAAGGGTRSVLSSRSDMSERAAAAPERNVGPRA